MGGWRRLPLLYTVLYTVVVSCAYLFFSRGGGGRCWAGWCASVYRCVPLGGGCWVVVYVVWPLVVWWVIPLFLWVVTVVYLFLLGVLCAGCAVAVVLIPLFSRWCCGVLCLYLFFVLTSFRAVPLCCAAVLCRCALAGGGGGVLGMVLCMVLCMVLAFL